jgi:two-component system NtrC family response regulator
MADGQWITEEDLELASPAPSANPGDSKRVGGSNGASAAAGLKEARERLEREMVLLAMERNDGNVSAAAKELGISRPTFYELMNKLGLSKEP